MNKQALRGDTERIPVRMTVFLWILLTVFSLPQAACAESDASIFDMFKPFGDLRFRFEQDWDSKRANGKLRDDRARARIRARLGLKITPNKYIELLGRVRTGSNDNQQSPHITIGDFSGNHHGDADLVFDKWYVKLKSEFGSIWGGRNGLPFWKQNELLWDDDVTIVGGGASVSYPLGPGKLQVNVGYATLPDGMERLNGEILTGQLVYFYSPDDFQITSALGVLAMSGEEGAVNLRNNNGARDYTILTGSLQAGADFSGIPVTLGVDVYHNIEDYSAKDNNTFTAKHHDEVDGFVISLKAGKLKQRNDWLVGYYYAEIESLAVNASFAQDDWMRWGSATQTDSSDFKGHEFRLGYVPWKNINILGRFYLIDALSSVQDGKRFRLDINWKF